jgi:hypothetical protein
VCLRVSCVVQGSLGFPHPYILMFLCLYVCHSLVFLLIIVSYENKTQRDFYPCSFSLINKKRIKISELDERQNFSS